MSDFFLKLNKKEPKTIKSLLKKHFVPYLQHDAFMLHQLIVEKYNLISGLVLEDQSMSYTVSRNSVGNHLFVFEKLRLKQKQLDKDLIEIAVSNRSYIELVGQIEEKEDIVWHDHQSASLAVTVALITEPRFNVCAPHHSKNICLWIMACIEILKHTHAFNISIDSNKGMKFRASSKISPTIVSVKTRSWTDASIDQFIIENPKFSNVAQISIS